LGTNFVAMCHMLQIFSEELLFYILVVCFCKICDIEFEEAAFSACRHPTKLNVYWRKSLKI
jgi:hypothetical protein